MKVSGCTEKRMNKHLDMIFIIKLCYFLLSPVDNSTRILNSLSIYSLTLNEHTMFQLVVLFIGVPKSNSKISCSEGLHFK